MAHGRRGQDRWTPRANFLTCQLTPLHCSLVTGCTWSRRSWRTSVKQPVGGGKRCWGRPKDSMRSGDEARPFKGFIPAAEQQALVTDRVLSLTGIIYKLLVRFQPGGAGEKQLLLTQLTAFPKSKDAQELVASLRNWRRHFGRAQEVEATLPDGVLLLKVLEAPLQQLGTLDAQAAFRLAQSRMQL